MQDEPGELDAGLVLEGQDGIDDIVEAVGLAGRARAHADDLVHIGEMRTNLIDIALGVGVVGVGADKDLIIFVIKGGCGQTCHFTHHTDLLPGRDHDGKGLFGHAIKAFLIRRRMFVIDAEMAETFARPIGDVDEQIIEPEQENRSCQQDHNDLERKENVNQGIDKGETHAHSSSDCAPFQSSSRCTMRSQAFPSPKGECLAVN